MGISLKHIFKYKCPKCRKGDIFTKPFNIRKPLDMPKRCSSCDMKIEPEPGFFFGAMFLSYILSGWAILLPTLLLVFYFKWSFEAAMGFAVVFGALIYFRLMRGSRSLWLHLMVKYDPKYEQLPGKEKLSENADSI